MGMEVSILDFMALIALLILPTQHSPKAYYVPMLIYIFVLMLSVTQAPEPMAAFFGVWQYLRMFLIVVVVARASAYEEVPSLIYKGMMIGIVGQFIAVVWQRFGLGLPQNTGLFVHQNTLGMSVHFVLFPHLVMLLSGRKNLLYLVGSVLVMLTILIFTASRASLGMAGFGIALTFALMALIGLTRRKIAVVGGAVLVAVMLLPVAVSTFEKRFEASPLHEDAYDERAAFNQAALFMLHDSPMGVGANHYVYAAQSMGYSDRAGVDPSEGNRRAIVHNAYMLAGAETGYLGMVAFCLMVFTPMLLAFVAGFRNHDKTEGQILLGCAIAMFVAYVHSGFEWIIFTKEIQYLLAMTFGLVIGVATRQRARQSEYFNIDTSNYQYFR